MTRVGFEMIGGPEWRGGYNYLFNLLTILCDPVHATLAIECVLFVGPDLPAAESAPFEAIAGLSIVRGSAFARSRLGARAAGALLCGHDAAVTRALDAADIAVVFASTRIFGRASRVPVLAWIPDLQHRKLPALFSAKARVRRELGFRAQFAEASAILLSSDDARSDFAQFYAKVAKPICVARFATRPPLALGEAAVAATLGRYAIERPYFFLPNQFYPHKNHAVAVAALSQCPGARIVVTGGPVASAPGLIDSLRSEAARLGVGDRFTMLGQIPFGDVMALLHASRALLNPSRFEGWSTTVEEAKALGKTCLLSDIAVHREQAGDTGRYFAPDDDAALAALMRDCLNHPEIARDAASLSNTVEARTAAFARAFADAVESARGG